MRETKYILEGKIAVPEPDIEKWGKWYEENHLNRHVGDTKIGDVRISTVFLALDHNYSEVGEPILFETMVFGGAFDQEQIRYCTWEEAEEGHTKMVQRVQRKET